MSEDENTRGWRRYIGLDIHKHYCVVVGVDRDGRVVLHAVRVEHADLEDWLKKNLRSTDHVVVNIGWECPQIIKCPLFNDSRVQWDLLSFQ